MDIGQILTRLWSQAWDDLSFWGWVIVAHALIVAALYLWRDRTHATQPWRAFFRYVFPKEIYASRSTGLDVQILLANFVLGVAVLAPIAGVSTLTAGWVSAGLTESLGAQSTLPEGDLWPGILLTMGLVVAMDLGFFVSHWLQHRVAWLWEFHKIHHSATVLTPLTTYRQHPFDQMIDGTLIGLTTGIAIGLFDYRYMGVAEPLTVMGCNIGIYVFYICGAHLRHSHLWLSYPAWLSHVLISPAQHQLHHSTAERHRNVNFGGIFAVWDALAGTLYVARRKEALTVGLAPNEQQAYTSLIELYGRPVIRVLERCLAALGAGSASLLGNARHESLRRQCSINQEVT